MTAGTIMSIALTLALVLGVMGIALKLLRRYTMGATSANAAVSMEVVQRLTLGQRQGIAVVRIGSRVLAVSMGDGGVHPIAELNPTDLPAAQAAHATPAASAAPVPTRDVLNLRAMTTAILKSQQGGARSASQPKRMSYVAPMEDFQAVLNMTMREPMVAHR